MSGKRYLREAYEMEAHHGPFFTGGIVQWTRSGDELLCQCGAMVQVVSVALGRVVATLGQATSGDEALDDVVTTFALASDDRFVVSSHRSGLFRLWDWRDAQLQKMWKSIHKGPVVRLVFSNDGCLLASGGSDSSVRIWDLQHQACVLNLRGAQGVISVLQFHECQEARLVFAAGDDATILGWDVNTGALKLSLSGHFSKVTGLAFHLDSKHMTSCGRDKVLMVWNLVKCSRVRTLALYESLESIVPLPSPLSLPGVESARGLLVATAGNKGAVRVWDVEAGHEVYLQSDSLVTPATEDGGLAITQLLYNTTRAQLAVVSADHNVLLLQLPSFLCCKQLVGFSDEVLDVVYVGVGDSHLAVATNSPDIKLYDTATMGCRLLRGHSDIVLSLATSPANPELLASSAKDNSVRLWLVGQEATCVAAGYRHTASVGSVALSWKAASVVVSASQDCCLKLWNVPVNLAPGKEQVLTVKGTQHAHDKDVNCVCMSPNDQLLASGSQDKTAKLWSADDLSLRGVLRGHRRGVWCVRFSPVDQVLLSTSADCCLKLWSIEDLSCIKTLEGHECSVLRGEFLSRGMQLVSTAADGLVKVWSIKSSESVCTLERHSDRVWALTVARDGDTLVTGGADSCLVVWHDVTLQRQLAAHEEKQKLLLQEQQLANLVQADQQLAALCLALSLHRPQLVLRLVKGVMQKGGEGLMETLRQLKVDQKQELLKCVSVWNTNSRNCHAAQLVTSLLLDEVVEGRLPPAGWLEDMLPYTQRHWERLTQLLQDMQLLNYSAACMRPHAT